MTYNDIIKLIQFFHFHKLNDEEIKDKEYIMDLYYNFIENK
jgi:hypothetical protein